MADKKQLEEKILKRQWFHSIDLGEGLITPGRIPLEYLQCLAERVRIPKDLSAQRVLDIGAWDGFFSFDAEKRGAAEILAMDIVPVEKTGFNLAKDILQSKAAYKRLGVYDISPSLGEFDTIIFLGVLYHLRYPIFALDKIWGALKPGGTLLLETACLDNYLPLTDTTVDTLKNIDPLLEESALLQFYRLDELNPGDFSNWFSFSRKALEDILISAGFEINHVELWGGRVAINATKLEKKPEYLQIQSYEAGSEGNQHFSESKLKEFETRRKMRSLRPQRNRERATGGLPSYERWQQTQVVLRWLRESFVFRLMRKLGRWGWLEKSLEQILGR